MVAATRRGRVGLRVAPSVDPLSVARPRRSIVDMTTADATASTDGEWTTYDDFAGPELDPTRWEPLDLGSGPRLEPQARTTVGDGVLTLDVPEFLNADADSQMLDNSKHLVFATQPFALPADGVARFAVDLRADVGDGSGDYRHGFASFNLADRTGGTHMVFNVLSTGARLFAEHEVLPVPGQADPFTRVVEDPFFFARSGTRADAGFRHCEIAIDRARREVVWKVDDRVLHVASGLDGLPEQVSMAFGMLTLLPIGEGEGSSHGQGGRASWRAFAHSISG